VIAFCCVGEELPLLFLGGLLALGGADVEFECHQGDFQGRAVVALLVSLFEHVKPFSDGFYKRSHLGERNAPAFFHGERSGDGFEDRPRRMPLELLNILQGAEGGRQIGAVDNKQFSVWGSDPAGGSSNGLRRGIAGR